MRSALWLFGLLITWPVAAAETGRVTPVELSGIINRGSHPKRVALTFDACPVAANKSGYDADLIAVLRRERVPATLFLSGSWTEKHAQVARDLATDPLFEIGSHGYQHRRMVGLPVATVRQDLLRAQTAIEKVTGQWPRLWRPPYGDADMAAVRAAVQLGLQTVDFSIASGDSDPNIGKQRLLRRLLEQIRGGSIVVFHMNGNGLHTAAILPDLVTELRRRGFELVTVGDLLGTRAELIRKPAMASVPDTVKSHATTRKPIPKR